jgi:uncharacterized membrane protein YfcA
MPLLLFFSLLLIAEVLGTIGGFGSSMLAMPLASAFMPFEQALGLTAVFHLFSNGAKMYLFRQGFHGRLLLWLGVPAVISVLIGAWITQYVEGHWLARGLGTVLIAISLLLLLFPSLKLRATQASAAGGGALSGFIAGVAGTGGAIRGITLAAFDLEKNVFVSTSAWIDMGVDLSRSLVYTAHGYVQHLLQYLPIMAAASVLGSWLGKQVLERVPQEQFRRIVLLLVLGVGIATLLRAS